MKKLITVTMLLIQTSLAQAAELPREGQYDNSIQTIEALQTILMLPINGLKDPLCVQKNILGSLTHQTLVSMGVSLYRLDVRYQVNQGRTFLTIFPLYKFPNGINQNSSFVPYANCELLIPSGNSN